MATSITPRSAMPTTSGSISGSFSASGAMLRLSAVLTESGRDRLYLIKQNGTGYWEKVQAPELELEKSGGDAAVAGSIDVVLNNGDTFHVVSETGKLITAGSVTIENLSPTLGVVAPAVSGDTIALLAASQSLSSKTLVSSVVSTGLTASGSASTSSNRRRVAHRW